MLSLTVLWFVESYLKGMFARIILVWAEEIIELMEEKGLMEEDWNDRDEWKKII